MKMNKVIMLIFLLSAVLFLTGCATGLTPSSWTGMSAEEEVVFIAAGQRVYAIRLTDGREIWNFPEKTGANKTYYAAPTITPDGQVIIGGYDQTLYSLDKETGAINWQFEDARDRWIGSVLVANEMIYAPCADYTLYALDLDGVLQWKFEADQALWAKPVADDGRVYLVSLDHRVYALDAFSGIPVWPEPQELDGAILNSPVLGADDVLYVSTFGGSVYAIDTDTGDIIWQFSGTSPFWSAPVFDQGKLYIGNFNGVVYTLDAETGNETVLVEANGAVFSQLLIHGDQLILNTDTGFVYFIDLASGEFDTQSFGGEFYASPVSAGDLILIAPQNESTLLIALETDGSQQWTFTPEE